MPRLRGGVRDNIKQRLESCIRRAVRLGFCAGGGQAVADLVAELDDTIHERLQWRTQRGRGVGGSNPPIESSKKFVLYVCKIYSPSPALVFMKSKILYRKTLEIVR